MKYKEENIKALIQSIKEYQSKLHEYNHDDTKRFNTKLNMTIVRVILSVIYNNHLPSTIFIHSSSAKEYVVEVLGEEVTELVGFDDEQWLRWLNKSITEKQKFPYNVINKISQFIEQLIK